MTKTVEPEHPCTTRSQATMRNPDGTVMLNEYGETIYQAQFLNSHPLKRDCKERTGPNGMVLTYVTGSGVIRDLNSIFGHGNWSTEITMTKEIVSECGTTSVTSHTLLFLLNSPINLSD